MFTIAEIKTGIFAKPGHEGEVVYLQARHFDKFGNLHTELKGDLRFDDITENHLLRNGDVLFAAKGWKNFATVYRSDFPAVASTTFFVLRVRELDVIPEFLVWLLNEPKTKESLKGQAIGSAMVSISKRVLGNLVVNIPSAETQRQILDVSQLMKKENEIRLRIAELRQQIIHQAVKRAIN